MSGSVNGSVIDGEAAELCGYLLQCIAKAVLGIGCKERILLDVEGGEDSREETRLCMCMRIYERDERQVS